MLTGRGGNIGVSVGEDGVFLVDDQFAPLTPKRKAAIAALSEEPIRFVLNTHWHGDHTGGNENLGRAGTLIVAHDNVRTRMSVERFTRILHLDLSRDCPCPIRCARCLTPGKSPLTCVFSNSVPAAGRQPSRSQSDPLYQKEEAPEVMRSPRGLVIASG